MFHKHLWDPGGQSNRLSLLPPNSLPKLFSKAGPSDVGENQPPGPKSVGRFLVPGVGHRTHLTGSASYWFPRAVGLLFSLKGRDGSSGERLCPGNSTQPKPGAPRSIDTPAPYPLTGAPSMPLPEAHRKQKLQTPTVVTCS